MSESTNADQTDSLDNHAYGDLMNLARSMNEQFEGVEIDTDAPRKDDELIPALEEYSPEGSRDGGWTVEVDGSREDVDLLAVQTPDSNGSSGSQYPSDKTILYCLTRAATTEERLSAINEALTSETDFELQEAGDGDKVAIVLPKESQEGWVPEDERDDDEDDEAEDESEADEDAESDEEAESDDESGSGESEAGEEGEDEESDETDSEAADEESESEAEESDGDDDTVSAEEYVSTQTDAKSKDELYSNAVDANIPNRSDLNKQGLAEALALNVENVDTSDYEFEALDDPDEFVVDD